MSLKVGNTEISDLKIGTTDVQKVYKGNNLIWQRNALKPIQFYQNIETVAQAACNMGSNGGNVENLFFPSLMPKSMHDTEHKERHTLGFVLSNLLCESLGLGFV